MIATAKDVERIERIEKYVAVRTEDGRVVLPGRREPETRPGLIPLGRTPRDPYQFTGQPMPLPKLAPGPIRDVPPNWPARSNVLDAPYPGAFISDWARVVSMFASHYGEGRQNEVENWRYGI